MWWIFPIIIFIIVIAIVIIRSYKELSEASELCLETANNLGKTLSMRYDVMQELLDLVEGYIPDENQFVVKLLQIKLVPIVDRFIIEDEFVKSFKELIYKVELYDEIKDSVQYHDIMKKLSKAERNIQEANNYYNEKVNEYNKLLIKFPNNLTSKLFKFGFGDSMDLECITR